MRNGGRLESGLSVVVAVYNSETTLPALVARLEPVLRARAAAFELILVNDGSGDESWEIIRRLAARHRWIAGVDLARNYGQHNALLCGMRLARFDVMVTMDDDLQHPPEEIPRLLDRLAEGCDVVYGTPERQPHSVWRGVASQLTKLALQNAMGADIAGRVSAFRALRTAVREAFDHYRGPFVSIDTLLTWGASRFAAVAVRHDPRLAGQSNYTLPKLILHALNMMTGFTAIPLQLASWIGFAFTAMGFAVLVFVVGRYLLEGGSVPGFAFLASIIALFSGAQLFALGILGEYLARMHFRVMDKPPYVIRGETRAGQARYAGGAAEERR
jgi:undecaprenyl-phosphate 4-deoxy-4-formamido-L-arabinose transferase